MIDIRFVQFGGVLAVLVFVSLVSGCSEPTLDSAVPTTPSSAMVALQPEIRKNNMWVPASVNSAMRSSLNSGRVLIIS